VPTCKCFSMYEGEQCDKATSARDAQKSVVTVASVLAIVIMCLLFLTLILMDVDTLFRTLRPSRPRHLKPKLKKFKYKDFDK
jgi:hypothetical protein